MKTEAMKEREQLLTSQLITRADDVIREDITVHYSIEVFEVV